MIVKFGRTVHFAFQNFWRNFWLSAVTITILTLSVLSVNFFILAHLFTSTALEAIEQRVNTTVYFRSSVAEADITILSERLRGMPEVGSVEYVSKDTALQRLSEKYEKENSTIIKDSIQELDHNPLSASIVIRAKSVEGYNRINSILDEAAYAEMIERRNFDDRTLLIDKINALKKNINTIAVAVNTFFAILAIIIIFNTIRVSIYTRRKEVGIMKLVGATNSFIRAPLILESVLYSACAMVFALLILYPALGFIQPFATKFFDGLVLDVIGYFSNNFTTIFGYQFLAATLLSVISSSVAIGRYLKV